MYHKRREFLRLGSNLAAAVALGPLACKLTSNKEKANEGEKKDSTTTAPMAIQTFGLQLYTLRDDMPKDPKGVLKQVASFGYKQVEGYEGGQGLFSRLARAWIFLPESTVTGGKV